MEWQMWSTVKKHLPLPKKMKLWWWMAMCTVCILIITVFIHSFDLWPSLWGESVEVQRCSWTDSDPALYQMNTETNVYYDGGQWYHMTENFLMQHSILRADHRLSSAASIFYNFDKDHFIDNLSGVTRLMVFLGTASVRPNAQSLHYLNAPLDLDDFQADDGILLPKEFFKQGQSISITDTEQTSNRFVRLLQGHELAASLPSPPPQRPAQVCARYMGDIGGKLRRKGSWFTEAGDITSLRHKMRRACPRDSALVEKVGKRKKYKLVLYQRDRTRRLSNQDEALQLLRQRLPENEWEIMLFVHDNMVSPCELMHILSDADVLLTPHGFQSILLLYLPIPALLFEIFPSHYHRNVYRLVAEEYGLVHGYAMSAPTLWHSKLLLSLISTHTCSRYFMCRSYSRSQDVILSSAGVEEVWNAINRSKGRLEESTNTSSSSSSVHRDHLY